VIYFVLGYKSSGKSLFVENLLQLTGKSTLYIGTLPDYAYYHETIEIHKKRRPEEWGLIELIHDPACDLDVLYSQIDYFDNLMLDGLTFYILRCIYFEQNLEKYKPLFLDLLQRIKGGRGCTYIVDTPVPANLDRETKKTVLNLHYWIMRHAAGIFYVEKGKVEEMSFREAYRFNKLQMFGAPI